MVKLTVRRYPDRGDAEKEYLAQIDVKAEAVRAKIITATPGQTMTYEAKYEEAKRYPDEPPFPWLEGEAAELGMTVDAVAQSVLQARDQWQTLGVAIERKRLKAKADVREAATAAEMHRIVETLKSELETLVA